jgi:hypothetical protein
MDSYGWDVLQESEENFPFVQQMVSGLHTSTALFHALRHCLDPFFFGCEGAGDRESGQVGKQKMTKDDGFFHFTLASCFYRKTVFS